VSFGRIRDRHGCVSVAPRLGVNAGRHDGGPAAPSGIDPAGAAATRQVSNNRVLPGVCASGSEPRWRIDLHQRQGAEVFILS
jgi:hypothetical protein